MSQTQEEKWVELKFFVPESWKRKLEEMARKRGKRTISELLRDIVEKALEGESR